MTCLFDHFFSSFSTSNLYLKTNLFTNLASNFLYQCRDNIFNNHFLISDLVNKIFQAKSNNIHHSSIQSEDISLDGGGEINDNSDYDVLYEKLKDIEDTIVKIHNYISDK